MRGIDESRLARLCAPAGPDAGARTPGEIALVSIVGVLAMLRGRPVARTQVQSQRSDGAAPDAVPAAPVAPLEAAEGKFVNPVCGVAVSMVNPLHVETYEAPTTYNGCWVKFRQDPAKYAAIHHAAAASVPA
jgi:hypothetical protein